MKYLKIFKLFENLIEEALYSRNGVYLFQFFNYDHYEDFVFNNKELFKNNMSSINPPHHPTHHTAKYWFNKYINTEKSLGIYGDQKSIKSNDLEVNSFNLIIDTNDNNYTISFFVYPKCKSLSDISFFDQNNKKVDVNSIKEYLDKLNITFDELTY